MAMEEYPGEAIIAMKAKDQRENLSPSRGEAMEEETQGEKLSTSLLVAPECHREGSPVGPTTVGAPPPPWARPCASWTTREAP